MALSVFIQSQQGFLSYELSIVLEFRFVYVSVNVVIIIVVINDKIIR